MLLLDCEYAIIKTFKNIDYSYLEPDQAFEELILTELSKRPLTTYDLRYKLGINDLPAIVYFLKRLIAKQKVKCLGNNQRFYKLARPLRRELVSYPVVNTSIPEENVLRCNSGETRKQKSIKKTYKATEYLKIFLGEEYESYIKENNL